MGNDAGRRDLCHAPDVGDGNEVSVPGEGGEQGGEERSQSHLKDSGGQGNEW